MPVTTDAELYASNAAINAAMYGALGEHRHVWGAVELAHFTGNPHRKCTVEGCRWVTLDLYDECEECGEIHPEEGD